MALIHLLITQRSPDNHAQGQPQAMMELVDAFSSREEAIIAGGKLVQEDEEGLRFRFNEHSDLEFAVLSVRAETVRKIGAMLDRPSLLAVGKEEPQ